MRTLPSLWKVSPRESFQERHDRRREFNDSRSIVVQAWCEASGVTVRRTNDGNVLKFQCGPRAYAIWVLSRGHLTTCTDWLMYPTSCRRHKVYDYLQVLYHLEHWLRGASLEST